MTKETNINIPSPSHKEVNDSWNIWRAQKEYQGQEKILKLLFGKYKDDKSLRKTFLKVSALNNFYSTNVYDTYNMTKHIMHLSKHYKLEHKILQGDIYAVDDIRVNHGIEDERGERNLYSFATKYCSFHNEGAYPIYDAYVEEALWHFKNIDDFASFKRKGLKDYEIFNDIVNKFKEFYSLNEFSLKQMDIYLWSAGKDIVRLKKEMANIKS